MPLADGRDLYRMIAKVEWLPTMNLYELIQKIPEFIADHYSRKGGAKDMIGQFHLGLKYDMSIW